MECYNSGLCVVSSSAMDEWMDGWDVCVCVCESADYVCTVAGDGVVELHDLVAEWTQRRTIWIKQVPYIHK